MFQKGQQIGLYTLIRKIGVGGFGEVWLAERQSKFVTTKVAVKLPIDELVDHDAIKQEATLWEQASGHPNVLPIIDADEYDGQIVIVSEYAPDGSLEQWLKQNGKMPVEKAVEMTIQILNGLEFLHSRQIIHRDLKPANILLQGETPRLADFGISRVLLTTASSQTSNVSGTFAYMSPESFDGKRSIQTDLWAAGVNLYKLLIGQLPFPQKEPTALIAAVMMREFEPLPDYVPQNLKNVIAKALAKQPENRYQTANEMRQDLWQVLRGVEVQVDLSKTQKPFYIKEFLPESNDSQPEIATVVRAETPKKISKNDLTFITNEAGQSLADRLKTLIYPHTQFFDCLVGYFYLSGFHLLFPNLEKTDKVRILIGLKTDSNVFGLLEEAKGQGNLGFESQAKIKERVEPTLKNELEQIKDSAVVENGIKKFLEWCNSKKLEVKVFPSRKIHAKLYIMTFVESDRDTGRVITGSSNFSRSGLEGNLEFNVELKNFNDYEYALEKFNKLWEEAVEVTDEYVDVIKNKSHLAALSPKEIYLKFLYEYFRTEINQPRELEQDYQPENFMRLQYQHDAVLTAKRIVEEYGGVFIADVVGLGKTYMAAMLARELDGRSLVIAPPALIDESNPGAWGNVFRDFGVRGFRTQSIGKIDSILKLDFNKFQYVFIDEAHRFRNEDTETYAKLHRICRNKKVILVTATPFNNRPNDLLSQLKLFQNSKNSTLPNLPNLDNFFANLNKRLRPLNRVTDRDEYLQVMRENAREVRERILKYLMVRRTRSEISRFYADDLAKQKLKFPEVEAPRAVFYELSKRENEIFTRTIERIAKKITYARYRPLTYLPTELVEEGNLTAQFNLAGFMKVLLVKRLESSFEAFRLTLGRFIKAYEKFIAAYRSGFVYVSKKKTAVIFELIEVGDFEAVERIIETEEAERYDAEDFSSNFLNDLQNDLNVLQAISADWKTIDRDPKWEKFHSLLQDEPTFQDKKILLFTESKETAEYLCRRIADSREEDSLCFTGSSNRSLREEVIENFDARVRKPKDKYRILLTTDTLAEGVSLHRSNIVINYDIPWNPTRMMQRVGRVNRVDTKFDRVYTYNFFPSKEGNDEIGLRESAEAKIEAFIEMLGSDARLLTENEEIKSFNLFDRITSKEVLTGEDEVEADSELKYLQIIRDIQQNEKELFAHIKNLPKKARAAQDQQSHKNALLTYFRLGALDKFYLATMNNPTAQEIDFLEAVKILESDSDEKLPIGKDFFALLEKNQSQLESSLHADHEAIHAPAPARDVVSKLRRRLSLFKKEQMLDFTDGDEQLWQNVMRDLANGAMAKKTANAIWKAVEKTNEARVILEILKKNFTPDDFVQDEVQPVEMKINLREVILSEHLI